MMFNSGLVMEITFIQWMLWYMVLHVKCLKSLINETHDLVFCDSVFFIMVSNFLWMLIPIFSFCIMVGCKLCIPLVMVEAHEFWKLCAKLIKFIDGFVIMLIIIYDENFFAIDQLMAYLASCYTELKGRLFIDLLAYSYFIL